MKVALPEFRTQKLVFRIPSPSNFWILAPGFYLPDSGFFFSLGAR